jgi:4-carboxymuconolactone decarboxylase
VLFGEAWSRAEQLSVRDRSLITVASVLASGSTEQLAYHLEVAND